MILFRARVRMQTACPSMYLTLRGTLTAATAPSVTCPLLDERGAPWPGMAAAMAAAQQGWHAEGRYPPAAVRVRSFRTHPVDTSPRAFRLALQGLLQSALLGEPLPRWCTVHTVVAAGALPAGLEPLIDAGHAAQAAELLLALLGEPPAAAPRHRFLQELQIIGDPALFARQVGVLFPVHGPAALRRVLGAQRQDLCDQLAGRSPRTWGTGARHRAHILERLSVPIDGLGALLSATLEGAALTGRQDEVWAEACAAIGAGYSTRSSS